MTYKNKTYVCFDADNDIHYYRLMTAWKENAQIAFNFHNAHEINNLRAGSSEETIKMKLRERLRNTKAMIVLIGQSTRNLYKYVRWEIEYAIEFNIPILASNINKKRNLDETLCPPILRDKLAIHIPFGQKIINYALNNWPESHKIHKAQGESGAYWYKAKVYSELGL